RSSCLGTVVLRVLSGTKYTFERDCGFHRLNIEGGQHDAQLAYAASGRSKNVPWRKNRPHHLDICIGLYVDRRRTFSHRRPRLCRFGDNIVCICQKGNAPPLGTAHPKRLGASWAVFSLRQPVCRCAAYEGEIEKTALLGKTRA